MSGLPWFRMWAEFSTDPVVQSLAFEDQRHFVMALCLKCSGVLDKEFPGEDVRDRVICKALGLDPRTAAEANRRLAEAGLVDDRWQPIKWEERQKASDRSTDRVRAFRSRARQKIQESETELDVESEGNRSRNGDETVSKRSTRKCPASFVVDEHLTAWAKQRAPLVDVPRETEKFRDYTFARAMTDWPGCWRNWMRKAQEDAERQQRRFQPPAPPKKAPPTPEEISAARSEAAAANRRELERVMGSASRPLP